MPPVRCCICRKGPPATLHVFPKDNVQLASWKQICNYDDRDNVSKLKICSNHFLPQDYFEPNAKKLGGALRLRPNTVPSVSVPNQLTRCEPTDVAFENITSEVAKLPEVLSPTMQSIDTTQLIRKQLFPTTTQSVEVTTSSINTELDETLPCTPKKRKFYSPRYVGEITSADVATPRRAKRVVALAQADIKKKARQIKTLQGKVGRLQKKVSSLQGLIKHLRAGNILSEDAGDTLMDILPDSVKQLIGRKLQTKRRRFALELRAFALTLQFYSAKAYSYVRRTWQNLLPHPSTLRAWYAVVDGKPGFTSEALSAIRVQASTKNILINLVIDEMALREQRIFDKNRFYGGVDLGTSTSNQDSDNIQLAKNALVFMAVCVNGGWKVPVAYFLIKGLTSSERANLLKTCLELLHETGAHVRSITFDGASVNLGMCNNMGANFNFSSKNFKPWIEHPITKKNIYIFFDACHMIKLVRNTLGDKGLIVDGDNKKINWLHITELNKIQLKEGLHLATKITTKHIKYYDNRMNVKLATQTLGKSVYNALLFLKQTKYNPVTFDECEGTANFCLMCNNIFDMLNCRNKFSKHNEFNRPLSNETIENCREKANILIKYIVALKDPHGIKLIDGPRKIGFLGLVIDLTNVFKYFEDIKDIIDYLLTFKLSQDFIETYFSAIRSRGGFNNNPNAKQFESAFRRLLIRSEIKIFDNSNCLADGLDILHISSKRSQYVCPLQESCENISADVFDHDYVNTMWKFNNYVENVIEYISGFVVNKILASNMCTFCKRYLVSSEKNCLLINLKNEGKLIYPSKDVTTICQIAERVYRENITKIFSTNIKSVMINNVVRRCYRLVFNNQDLITHVQSQDYLDNHISQLIKIIVDKYYVIRLFHECKLNSSKNEYVRSKYHRLILFKNQ